MRLDLLLCVFGIHRWQWIYPWGEEWKIKRVRQCRRCRYMQVEECSSGWDTADGTTGYAGLEEKLNLYDVYQKEK